MYLKNISLRGFRNLSTQTLEFSPGINWLTGLNGQGKTNLLEAVFLLSGAKSFRGASSDELISYNSPEAIIQGEAQSELTNNFLELSLGKKEKKYLKDSNPVNFIDFYGNIICVSFAPSDMFLVKGAPLGRRQFMDRHIVDLNKNDLTVFMNYNRALKSKNRILKENATAKEIEAWNEILINTGVKISILRKDFIDKLKKKANSIFYQYAETDGELSLKIKGDFFCDDDSILNSTEAARVFSENLQKELLYKKSMIGSQRDDLEILFNGNPAVSFASQGQSKSIALSFKLALLEMIEEQRGESPILILDDLESELDNERNSKISALLFSKERQAFISGTSIPENDYLRPEMLRIFHVSNGEIRHDFSYQKVAKSL